MMKKMGGDKLWVEVEVREVPRLLECLCWLRGAVMKTALGWGPLAAWPCV